MDRIVNRGRRRTAFAVRAILIAAAVLLGGYGVTGAKHMTTASEKTVASSVDTGATTPSSTAVEGTATPLTEPERVRTASDSGSEPRECDLAKGVSSACVFE